MYRGPKNLKKFLEAIWVKEQLWLNEWLSPPKKCISDTPYYPGQCVCALEVHLLVAMGLDGTQNWSVYKHFHTHCILLQKYHERTFTRATSLIRTPLLYGNNFCRYQCSPGLSLKLDHNGISGFTSMVFIFNVKDTVECQLYT